MFIMQIFTSAPPKGLILILTLLLSRSVLLESKVTTVSRNPIVNL